MTSVRYEWMFWQQAWEFQTWPSSAVSDHDIDDPDEAIRAGTAMG